RYTATSRLSLPLPEGKSQQPFSCRATNSRGTAVTQVSNPGDGATPRRRRRRRRLVEKRDPLPNRVTLHPPSREDFEGPYRNSTLLCRIRGKGRPPAAAAAAVGWLKNGIPFQTGITTENSALAGQNAYVIDSRVVVTEAEWDAGTVYTCRAGDELRNTSKALECG
ncbi:IGHM protein, partial [Pelecanoides urinatrix]|nr:IGHM protein [Pelecanoides urinatrix]